MHIRKYLSIFLIGFAFVVAGCSGGSSSSGGSSDADLLPDTDGDGIVDQHDFDIDGDGIDNNIDDDIDGDGTLNKDDSTANGPVDEHEELDLQLPYPNRFCTSAQIIPPNDDHQTGATVIVKWKLLPKKCGWDQNRQTGRASAASNAIQGYYPLATYSRPVSPGLLKASLVIPHHCALNSNDLNNYPIRYTIKEIQKAVAGKNDWPAYEQTVHHYIGNGKTFCPGNSLPPDDEDTGETQCSDFSGTNGGTYPNCTCETDDHIFEDGACVVPTPGDGDGSDTAWACPTENGIGGTYPACTCKVGYDYNESENDCIELPTVPVTNDDFAAAITSWFTEEDDAAFAKYGHISNWDVSAVKNMHGAFDDKTSFNEDISGWSTSNVTDMYAMFANTPFNRDISGWDVSNVANMGFMFLNAKAFKQDLSGWCVYKIKTKPSQFDSGAHADLISPQWGTCP